MIKSIFQRLFHLQKPTWLERYFIWILISAAVVAMVISLAIGLAQSVWFDEAYSVLVAKQPLGHLLYLTGLDTHPPFYYLLLKSWASIFGWSELALRSLSVLMMGGAVVMGGLLVKRTFGAKAAVIALPFVVLSPFLLRYGFELRPYALASLIGIAATYVLIMAADKEGQNKKILYGVYAVLVALGMYSLYYMALLWLTHVIWLIWKVKPTKQSIFKTPWVIALAGSVILFLPWLPTFIGQITNGALAPISQAMTLDNLLGIVSFGFVYQPVWQLSPLTSLLIVFVLICLSYFAVRAFKLVSKSQRSYLVLLALYVLVPISVLTLVSLVRPMYVERYLSHILIGGSLFIGVTVVIVTKGASNLVKSAAAMLLVVMLVGVVHLAQVGNYNFQRLQKPTVNSAAAVVSTCKDGSTVLAADPYVAIELSYYLPDCQVYFYSQYANLRGGYAPLSESALRVDQPAKQLAGSKLIYYVDYNNTPLDAPIGMKESSRWEFDALKVSLFRTE